ncbi:MAG: type I restriction enzyme EcoKI subunit R [Syntrophorhabdus sp. PtaU1.Bin002]|nr:MAG: type I restriction enzyme EcoKI subunit R [Syntrophorhabdus sp. PtaU1.Bin002]
MDLFNSNTYTYTLRPYQQEAVDAAVKFLKGSASHNAIEVLPTGSGKSLIIANIAMGLGEPTLIFQPSKEILEQNYAKFCSYGYQAGIYSASKNRRELSRVTFATIGSVKNRKELFSNFRYIIVDEAHFINSKGGMYHDFLNSLRGAKILGLTATPYRLTSDGFGGSILKFLTRTRPRVFQDLIYYVQNRKLFDEGYLAKLQYDSTNHFDRRQLVINSTGADFTDSSVRRYYRTSNFPDKIAEVVKAEIKTRKNALVFTRFIEEAAYIVEKVPGSALITGETPKKERERLIEGFKSGRIPVVANAGVLTTGFDYPELETIILARPTMSLALYYQIIGRGIRPHPEKRYTKVVDMCNNGALFGRVEDLEIVDGGNGKWFIQNGKKQLTNVYYGERRQH